MHMNIHQTIQCPKCASEIDVYDVLYEQTKAELQKEFSIEIQRERDRFAQERESLKVNMEEFEKSKEKQNEDFNRILKENVDAKARELEKTIKSKIELEKSEQIFNLEKELNETSAKVIELNKSKAEIERLKREKAELKSTIEAESEAVFNDKLSFEKERIRKTEQDKNELAIRELQKQLDDQKKLTEEMKRKQEQGSVQLQGEVQELAIEEWLRNNFPFDTIVEVKKGARGADCRHIVNTKSKENCGCIYYESKRTKEFGKDWIEKFKNDIRAHGANIGILVTDVMPSGMERMGLREGVWVCSYDEFKGLCFVIREHIKILDLAIASQENKGEKMAMLYGYLTSNEFRLQVEGIIEGYSQMRNDLELEKRSISGLWKKREKQLQKVLENTNFMYNSIRGIAGNAVQAIKILELPEYNDEDMIDAEIRN